MPEKVHSLYRSKKDRMFMGVCAGIGEFTGIDPTIVRLATVALAFTFQGIILAYLLMMFIIPEEPADA